MSGDEEKREGVLRPGKYYFDRAWNDPPEFEHDAQAKAAAATSSRGSAGLKFNKRVGHSLASGTMPSSTGKAAPAAGGGGSGDDGLFPPKLQDAGARSLADILPPPPPPPPLLSSSNLQISGDSLSKVKRSSERDAVDGGTEVDVDSCVRDLETIADNSSDMTEDKRKDIKRRIGTMATKWKSGSLSKKVEAGMGRVTQLLTDGDAAGAERLLQSMIVDFPSHCNPWAVGIKHLIASVKPKGDIFDEAAVKGIANPL